MIHEEYSNTNQQFLVEKDEMVAENQIKEQKIKILEAELNIQATKNVQFLDDIKNFEAEVNNKTGNYSALYTDYNDLKVAYEIQTCERERFCAENNVIEKDEKIEFITQKNEELSCQLTVQSDEMIVWQEKIHGIETNYNKFLVIYDEMANKYENLQILLQDQKATIEEKVVCIEKLERASLKAKNEISRLTNAVTIRTAHERLDSIRSQDYLNTRSSNMGSMTNI